MKWETDKTLIILCSGIVFFAALILLVEKVWPSDSQIYTIFATAFGNFSGALMPHMRPSERTPPPGSVTDTSLRQTTVVPGGGN